MQVGLTYFDVALCVQFIYFEFPPTAFK